MMRTPGTRRGPRSARDLLPTPRWSLNGFDHGEAPRPRRPVTEDTPVRHLTVSNAVPGCNQVVRQDGGQIPLTGSRASHPEVARGG
jgi:hypothetical protein